MVKRGFVYDLELSLYFRSTTTTHNWLDNTIMVFWKKTYYADRDLKPTEDFMLSIKLIPLTAVEQKFAN